MPPSKSSRRRFRRPCVLQLLFSIAGVSVGQAPTGSLNDGCTPHLSCTAAPACSCMQARPRRSQILAAGYCPWPHRPTELVRMGGSRLVVASVCRLLLMLPASREEQGSRLPSGGLDPRVSLDRYFLASVEIIHRLTDPIYWLWELGWPCHR